ncbi:MAG: CDP-alcohol phosphatidyltransferase family protein, partial [Prevotella sp.]|nr:CDP-alcohol phosphatidyltransferase family protein [Prevotella sp.]
LFFLKGEKGAELDNSVKQQEIYDQMGPETPSWEKLVQKTYITYTKQQERRTPQFQNLMAKLKEKYGNANNTPADIREEIHRESLKVMKYNFMLVFNFRTPFLFLFCLLDIPVLYFLFEIIVISLIEYYAIHRHEAFCKRIAQSIK